MPGRDTTGDRRQQHHGRPCRVHGSGARQVQPRVTGRGARSVWQGGPPAEPCPRATRVLEATIKGSASPQQLPRSRGGDSQRHGCPSWTATRQAQACAGLSSPGRGLHRTNPQAQVYTGSPRPELLGPFLPVRDRQESSPQPGLSPCPPGASSSTPWPRELWFGTDTGSEVRGPPARRGSAANARPTPARPDAVSLSAAPERSRPPAAGSRHQTPGITPPRGPEPGKEELSARPDPRHAGARPPRGLAPWSTAGEADSGTFQPSTVVAREAAGR